MSPIHPLFERTQSWYQHYDDDGFVKSLREWEKAGKPVVEEGIIRPFNSPEVDWVVHEWRKLCDEQEARIKDLEGSLDAASAREERLHKRLHELEEKLAHEKEHRKFWLHDPASAAICELSRKSGYNAALEEATESMKRLLDEAIFEDGDGLFCEEDE